MHRDMKTALLAGLLSGGLFILVFGIGLGFIFMFLPTLPLFYAGLSRHARLCRDAALFACGFVALLSGLPAVVLYLLFLGLPSSYLCQKALLWRPEKGERRWYPIGVIMTRLSLWGVGAIALITLYYWNQEGGLPGLLAGTLRDAFAGLQDSYGEVIETLASHWSFLIFPVTLWLWCIMLYAHAWLVQRWLVKKNRQRRPDLAVTAFPVPGWMLSLLAICALASLIGSDSMRFLGKASLVSLMLPYFFLGAAFLKDSTRDAPNPRLLLFFIYFLVFTQFWPALILSALGLWCQIKHLSGGETSSKK